MIDRSDIDGYAAEYVLGTLSREQRKEINVSRLSNPSLDNAISSWENRLAPLNESVPEAVPSSDLFAKIERHLPTRPVAYESNLNFSVMTRRDQGWRALAIAASLAFVIALSFAFYTLKPQATLTEPIAILQAGSISPAFLISLNDKEATLTVRSLAVIPPTDKNYELWLITEGALGPQSLGVLPNQDLKLIKLADRDTTTIRRATLAVSIEPIGGSPTGAPTGPVVFSGKFL